MVAWQQLLNGKFRPVLGRHGQSEWELARGLLRQLPKAALLLADRLHGCGAFAAEALAASARVGSHFLFRARSNVKARGVRRCKDGSRLVRQKGKGRRLVQWIAVRAIRGRVGRKGHQPSDEVVLSPAGPHRNLRRLAWSQVLLASVLMVATLPGRTQGLGLVTEPLLKDLQLDPVQYAPLLFALAGVTLGLSLAARFVRTPCMSKSGFA